MADLEQLVEQLSNLTVKEVADLVKMLEERWGVSAAAPVVAAAPAAAAAAPAEEAQPEKTEFDVILKSVGPKKIQVIKAIRQIVAGIGLKEAKQLAETPDAKVLEGVPKEEAEKAKKLLEEAGATVEIK